jgi:hypothetical protein
VALVAELSAGKGGKSPLMPPQAKYNGISSDDLSVLASEYAIATSLGAQIPPNGVKNVQFLPGNTFSGTEATFDVEVAAGTAIAFPSFFVFFENYDNDTFDDPNDPAIIEFVDFVFDTTSIKTTLDGKTLLDGVASDFADYQFGLSLFDEPIVYAEPQFRFTDASGNDVHSVSAFAVMGTGSVYHPLPVGEHTLVVDIVGPLGDIKTTYNITVSPN